MNYNTNITKIVFIGILTSDCTLYIHIFLRDSLIFIGCRILSATTGNCYLGYYMTIGENSIDC